MILRTLGAVNPAGNLLYITDIGSSSVDILSIQPPAPVITSVSPTTGTTAGGTTVTITGSYLTGASVAFGSTAATSVSCTATSCTATSPAESAGTVDTTATTPGGTSVTSSADQYTYVTPFTFTGFLLPVLDPPFTNFRIPGLDIFMNFSLGGNKGTGVIAAVYPTTQQINCWTHAPIGSPAAATSAGFTYDPLLGVYDYAWTTPVSFLGTCQQFTLKLTDGSTHSAYFSF
jgi:IPT/TIG domain